MKGVRFYRVCSDEGKGAFIYRCRKAGVKPTLCTEVGEVFAAFGDGYMSYSSPARWVFEGVGAVYFHPNSAVCGTSADSDYLRETCIRIGEKVARQVHPALFDYLDGAGE